MTLQERLADAERRSVLVYQRRSQLAEQQMQVQQAAMACDRELAAMDGEIRVLQALVDEQAQPASGPTLVDVKKQA